ncbi:MAG: hypothetical protein A3C43_03760 [Candidatus Schekmanbacteria bacterium RIFCSPHIGHO2_02_FULL_38_11]|uniref:Uncharacterized protein n=1 Tax=Candidatus Schekmanbacteria bacterium RIFCSPLOWO2_12_FULL_38_15 TaxID=1817883 RepID=A0A1F7SNT5_9BACT|nr:MAG: hypothetical protein A2043_02760 [Candidatus Schekmanbacteria bacterium GWA2_38_9]OGL50253.1 MAG: hypothetical protein A3H37_00680 [Candidatus Schekmanbacteria bacterium RIFCSPLOWO2_02_FULL_38_14]OGL52334.1 MAG: hypothetical protein A3C43_03760 [Candidatus Schekmanbacteria bacterium RIFCSPHIGHO2_02_FULL_38_11]OGL55436.1 MAG: hypothetical protein A3G31_01320 [Candidatus Schekmanbacteria bacterium RIFCSPLOWO2_12_FULL_38_15]
MKRNLFLTTIFVGVFISSILSFSYATAKGKPGKKPTVISITPKTGAQGEPLDVTIKGKNFVDTPTVSLGAGITVNGVEFVSATKLTANITIASDAKIGPKPVTVTNPDGKKSQAKKIFKVKKSTLPQADIIAKKVTDEPGEADWAKISGSLIQTTGNPATGGHGALGEENLVAVKLQASHDSTNIFMRFEWDDSTQNNTHEVWTYSASSSTWSKAGNEDRILIAWPITDVAGREGKTFQEIGCAMLCHLKDANDPTKTKIVPNTTDAVNDCSVCHPNSSGKDTTFVHVLPTSAQTCISCHADREIEEIADMGSPSGGAFDIWHWKAGRSDGIGLAEDQEASDGKLRTNDGAGLTSNNDGPAGFTDRPKYIWTAASGKGASPVTEIIKNSEIASLKASNYLAEINATDGKYYLSNGTTEEVLGDGAQVRRRILKDGTNITEPGNGDIKASSGYLDGKWTVVLKRKLNTTDTKDYVFKTGETDINYFGFAVTDNSGNSHKAKALLKLRFGQ